jgi:hypothetical protein
MKLIFVILLISSTVMADIPFELQPSQEPNSCFTCLSKEESQKAEECFQRDKLYQKELNDDSSILLYVLLGFAGGIAVGAIATAH